MSTKISRRGLLKSSAMLAATAGVFSAMPNIAMAETLPLPKKWDMTYDLVVAGGGIAGCMAAIGASNNGLKVLLIHAGPDLGGNSSISSAWIRSCNTKWHDARGIKDTVDAYVEDGIAYGNGTRDPKKVRVIAEKSSELVNTLIGYGVEFNNDQDFINGGPTLRIVKALNGGGVLMRKVEEEVAKHKNITVKTDARVLDLYKTINPDKLVGVLADIDEEEVTVKCGAFILATGGFGRNKNLVTKYMNEWKDTFRIMDIQDKGDGLVLATSYGAGSANLNIGMVTPTMEYSKKIFYASAPILEGAIFLNQDGNRFVNEYVIYTDTPRAMLKQEKVFEILTKDLHHQVDRMDHDGVLTKADSYEAIAKIIGCDVDNVKMAIEEHNKVTRQSGKRVDKFGRIAFNKELKPPFYLVRIWPVMIETVGGIFINEKAEVVNFGWKPVMDGFYAAGAVAFGEHFGRGYRSGDAYAYSGVFGMVAGEEASKYIKNMKG